MRRNGRRVSCARKVELNSIPARTPAPEGISPVWYVNVEMCILIWSEPDHLLPAMKNRDRKSPTVSRSRKHPKSRRRGWLTLPACDRWENWLSQSPPSQPPLPAVVTAGNLHSANSILKRATSGRCGRRVQKSEGNSGQRCHLPHSRAVEKRAHPAGLNGTSTRCFRRSHISFGIRLPETVLPCGWIFQLIDHSYEATGCSFSRC
jgi:hypothetical protein